MKDGHSEFGLTHEWYDKTTIRERDGFFTGKAQFSRGGVRLLAECANGGVPRLAEPLHASPTRSRFFSRRTSSL